MKIFVCEPLDPAALALLRQRAEVTDDPAKLGTVDAVITRNFAVDRAFFEKCPRLRSVGVHGRGLDGVDLTQARRRGVRVVYAPHENVESVAEHIAALLLALARRVPRADRMARAGAARPGDASLCGVELRGRTLGLVGAGEIGCRAGEILRDGFGMRLRVWSPSMTDSRARALGMERSGSLRELFGECDAVTVGVPLNDGTRNLIGPDILAAAKPGLLLVNTSRGGVVDEAALLRALTEGPLGGAACDVFRREPPGPENPLLGLENFIATPHIAATTREALRRTGLCVARQVLAVLDGKPAEYEV